MKFEIKSHSTATPIFVGKHKNLKGAVEAAVKTGADLAHADLAHADLIRANLDGASLTRASLAGANLVRANLDGANLAGANLTGANLTGANLTGANLPLADLADANLTDANLARANLARANLAGADLAGANLTGANLTGANLTDAKVGTGGDKATLVGPRPVVQIGPIGSENNYLHVFWCGDAGVRISTGRQKQITEAYFLERLADAHGEGDQANIHAQHYIEALAFAKRLLKDQAEGKL